VVLIQGPWINNFLDEVGAFPSGNHDDQVDAVTGAMLAIGIPTGAFSDPSQIHVPELITDHFIADRIEL
jgi:hypothetical protein